MSDSNFTYLEAAARRKKKNQVISILIIIAVVLVGAAIWGVREHQRNEIAERVKIALGNQTDSTSAADTTKPSAVPPPVESTAVQAPAQPAETTAVRVEPVPQVVPPKSATEKPAPHPKRSVASAKIQKRAEKKSPNPQTQVKHREPPVEDTTAAAELPVVKAATPPPPPAQPELPETTSRITAPPPPPPPTAAPAYAPVDQPMPAKAPLTEEERSAMNSMPSSMTTAPEGASDSGSDLYRQSMVAYHQGDLTNAIRLFSQLPKPETKKRGDPVRDEYVHGNFLRGLALMRTDHTSEAASAFLSVLEYEKYYPLVNMDLGICYVDLKQYAKAHQAFEAVVRDQTYIDPTMFDDVMQRTRYFWALAWTRMYHSEQNPDRQAYYKKQAILRWKDYLVWYDKNDKYHAENQKANDYLKSMSL